MYDNWATVAHLSRTYGYHPEYLRRLIREGKIAAEKVGTMWMVDVHSFVAYYARMMEKPQGGPRE